MGFLYQPLWHQKLQGLYKKRRGYKRLYEKGIDLAETEDGKGWREKDKRHCWGHNRQGKGDKEELREHVGEGKSWRKED